MNDYLRSSLEKLPPSIDVAKYWKLNSTQWPDLSALARDYLAIPATSAASERAFSTGRDLLGIYR